VYVRELSQLFDSMDPSPFHERDLDRNAHEYIVGFAKKLPRQAPSALIVHLDKPLGPPDEEQTLADAIQVHFARRAELARRELRQLMRRGWISLWIGLTVLAAALIGGELLTNRIGGSALARLLGTSLHIGGWVAMWKPIEILLYEWWPILGERRIFDRLSRTTVRIVYRSPPPADAPLEVDREPARTNVAPGLASTEPGNRKDVRT
jgi:hypothetical protein